MDKAASLRAFREARYKSAPLPAKMEIVPPAVPKRAAVPSARTPKAKKSKSKKINTRSKKQAKVMRLLKKAYPIYLEAHPECEIKSAVCMFHATVVNHNRGRGANVLNQDDWCPACSPCNNFIEENHAWAQERGFKARRIGPKTAKSLL